MAQEALTVGASLIPTLANDVVAVYDQNYNQVFPLARPLKAIVKQDSKLMEHPLETGATTVDHRIILPIEIEFSMILRSADYRSTYQDIFQIFSAGTLLIVQTRATTYTNQMIQSMPHEEDPALYDTLQLALRLKEVQFVVSQSEPIPKDPTNKSTVNRGSIESTPATTEQTDQGTLLYKGYKGLIGS